MDGKSVLFFGDINVDNIFTVDKLPEPGRDAYSEHAQLRLGGSVCNSAVVLNKLGQDTALFGALGDDVWANFVLQELSQTQVNSDFLFRKDEKGTGLIFIAVLPNGERTMFSYRGANTTIKPQDLPEDILSGVGLVQFSGYAFMESPQKDTALRLLEMARSASIPCCMDTGLDPVIHQPEMIHEVISKLDLLITGGQEAELLTGKRDHRDQANALLSLGMKQVAIKLGGSGAMLGWQNGLEEKSAFPVEVKDPTSAGDAFSAGLLFGFLHEMRPAASLTLANLLGGMATTVYGAAWIGKTEVLNYLETLGVDLEPDPGVFDEIRDELIKSC
jgi:ribokinase